MSFNLEYEWKPENIKLCEWFTAPWFYASPDEICHRWQASLYDEEDSYRVNLQLMDEDVKQPIYANLSFKVYNELDELIAEEQTTGRQFKKYCCWGFVKRHRGPPVKRICFNIQLFREKPSELKSSGNRVPIHSEPLTHQSIPILQQDLLKLYENGSSSDVTISCKGRDFKVHKNILESRSTTFKAIFKKERKSFEHQINDVDPQALELFLKFMYTGAIEFPVDMICDILNLAQKFNLQDLSNICKCEMVKNISVSTAVKFLMSSNKHKIQDLKKNVLKFMKENLKDVFQTPEFKTHVANRCDLMVLLIGSLCSDEEMKRQGETAQQLQTFQDGQAARIPNRGNRKHSERTASPYRQQNNEELQRQNQLSKEAQTKTNATSKRDLKPCEDFQDQTTFCCKKLGITTQQLMKMGEAELEHRMDYLKGQGNSPQSPHSPFQISPRHHSSPRSAKKSAVQLEEEAAVEEQKEKIQKKRPLQQIKIREQEMRENIMENHGEMKREEEMKYGHSDQIHYKNRVFKKDQASYEAGGQERKGRLRL